MCIVLNKYKGLFKDINDTPAQYPMNILKR